MTRFVLNNHGAGGIDREPSTRNERVRFPNMLVNQETTEDGSLTTVNQEAAYDVADDADGQHTPDGAADDETEQKQLL